jgi:hypothetical protein
MSDNVNHPAHYQGFSNGAEVIDITENLSFNLGNVVKYVARAGRKTDDPLEDLSKARFYLEREINRLREAKNPWSLDGVAEGLQKIWDDRVQRFSSIDCTADLLAEQLLKFWEDSREDDLPEGLEYDEDKFWRDKDTCLWTLRDDGVWLYQESDGSWCAVQGTPSNIYAPFKEVDLWQEGS